MFRYGVLFAALACSTTARADDLSDVLRGRWGQVRADWQSGDPGRPGKFCQLDANGKDTAFNFSGDLGNLMVSSDINRDSPGPVKSPLIIEGEVKQEDASGVMYQAKIIVAVRFNYRGLFGTQPEFVGQLGLVAPDRIVLFPNRGLTPLDALYLTKCPS